MAAEKTERLAQGRASRSDGRALDLVERTFLLALLGWFLYRLLPSVQTEPYVVLLLISEGITALLVLLRKRGDTASSAHAWAVAIIGTCAPLLVVENGAMTITPQAGTLLLASGLAFSLSAKLFLNRSFGIVAANRGIKVAGPYRMVRHPMYLGYAITHVGFLLLHLSPWNVVVYAVTWAAIALRIRAEEDILSDDQAYRDYSAAVRYKLFPGLY